MVNISRGVHVALLRIRQEPRVFQNEEDFLPRDFFRFSVDRVLFSRTEPAILGQMVSDLRVFVERVLHMRRQQSLPLQCGHYDRIRRLANRVDLNTRTETTIKRVNIQIQRANNTFFASKIFLRCKDPVQLLAVRTSRFSCTQAIREKKKLKRYFYGNYLLIL